MRVIEIKKQLIESGDVIGRYLILNEAERRGSKRYYLCKCECGNEKEVRMDSLRNGKAISCGCYNKEMSIKANTKHGMYKTRIYRIWHGMKSRCLNYNNDSYKNYGGRGISICSEWMDFSAFKKWSIINGYKDFLTIERVNVNGNYNPQNCTWISMEEQRRNTTVTKNISYDGKTLTLRQWAKEMNMCNSTLSRRLKKGWSVEKSLTTPLQRKVKHDEV